MKAAKRNKSISLFRKYARTVAIAMLVGGIESLGMAQGATSLTWSPDVGTGNWDFTTANWTSETGSTDYTDGSLVTFSGSTGASITVTPGAGVSPGSMTITGSGNWSFGGSPIYGATGITDSSSGTVTLNESHNSYTGTTAVDAGTMMVEGLISGTSSVNVGTGITPATLTVGGTLSTPGALLVGAKATLSGNGIVNAASVTVRNGATLAPTAFDGAGLTLNNGPVTLSTGSTLQFSLANSNAAFSGAAALADYSKLTLGSGATMTLGGSNIELSLTEPVNQGDLFTVIMSGSTVAGLFANTTDRVGASTYAFISNGTDYEINYAYSGGPTGSNVSEAAFAADTGGTDVAVLVGAEAQAVPEPNTWVTLLAGLVFLFALQRRFRSRRT